MDAKTWAEQADDLLPQIRHGVNAALAGMQSSSASRSKSTASVQAMLDALRLVANVGASIPEMSNLKGPLRSVATPLAKGVLRVAQLVTREQREFNHRALDLLEEVVPTDTARRAFESTALSFAQLAVDLRLALNGVISRQQATSTELSNLGVAHTHFADAIRREMSNTQGQMAARFTSLDQAIAAMRSMTSILDARTAALMTRQSAVSLPVADGGAVVSDDDAFYVAFEDRFRGTREAIAERVSVYVPMLQAAAAGRESATVLDLGCGRGELLEVCTKAGMKAVGVDLSSDMVVRATTLGLNAVQADVIAYLAKCPDDSVDAVTAIHLIEHLPLPVLRMLFKQALRVLRPGGMIIFETPNPRNLQVGACDFYTDPTHKRPLNPVTMQFMAEFTGFERASILELHPDEEPPKSGKSKADGALMDLIKGPRDYAVIGYKA